MMNIQEITTTMARRLCGSVLAVCLVAFAGQSLASAVQSIDYITLPGNKLQLQVTFDGEPPQTKGYSIEKPARIAIDLLGAQSALKEKYHSLGTGNARSVTVVEAKDRSRMIIDLMRIVGYKIDVEGDKLLITLGETGAAVSDATAQQTAAAPVSALSVANIDFRRGEQGGGDVVIKLSSSSVPVDVEERSGKVIARLANTALPAKLQRRLDVGDFGTPVSFIDAKTEGADSVITISATTPWDYLAYQTNDTFTINIKEKVRDEDSTKKQAFEYTGEKLSLDFQRIEVRSVLQLIADFTSLNLVASDTVQGDITLRLKNVPWDQALDLILKTKGLAKRQSGNVLMVAPADEIAAREQAEMQNDQKREQLEQLSTEFIRVNYAKATDIEALLKTKGSFLSERGAVSVDSRTNTLIIQDTAARLNTARNLIATLDVPVQQVLIEARVVTASTEAIKEIGVRWGGIDTRSFNGGSSTLVAGNSAAVTGFPAASGMVVDMGVESASTNFALGYMHKGTRLLDLELSALDSQRKINLVANPKVLTADQQTALISSGQEIPYITTTSDKIETEFKDAKLSLEVTPHITPDNRVIMDIHVTNDSVNEAYVGNVPPLDTNELKTTVLVEDGETVVLGGIFKNKQENVTMKTPLLGDIPWLGNLFRHKSNKTEKNELLIFITPKLVNK